MEQALSGYDAVLSPTVPIVAPRLDDVAPATGDDAAADAIVAAVADRRAREVLAAAAMWLQHHNRALLVLSHQ